MALLLLSGESVRNLIWISAQISQKLMSHETKGVQTSKVCYLLHSRKRLYFINSKEQKYIVALGREQFVITYWSIIAPVTRDVNLEDCPTLLLTSVPKAKIESLFPCFFDTLVCIFNDTLRTIHL